MVVTAHARRRSRQRRVPVYVVELVAAFGTPTPGASEGELRRLDARALGRAMRLGYGAWLMAYIGVAVVVRGHLIITVLPSPKGTTRA